MLCKQLVDEFHSGVNWSCLLQKKPDHASPKERERFMITAVVSVGNSLAVVVVANAVTDALLCLAFFQVRKIPEGYGQMGPMMPLRATQTALLEFGHN